MVVNGIYNILEIVTKNSSLNPFKLNTFSHLTKKNRIYIRGEFRESPGMNFVSPFQLDSEFKCKIHVNVHKLYAVEYINTVCSLDYPFQFRIF